MSTRRRRFGSIWTVIGILVVTAVAWGGLSRIHSNVPTLLASQTPIADGRDVGERIMVYSFRDTFRRYVQTARHDLPKEGWTEINASKPGFVRFQRLRDDLTIAEAKVVRLMSTDPPAYEVASSTSDVVVQLTLSEAPWYDKIRYLLVK